MELVLHSAIRVGPQVLLMTDDALILKDRKEEKAIPLSQVVSFAITQRPRKSIATLGRLAPGSVKVQLAGANDAHLLLTAWLSLSQGNSFTFTYVPECDSAATEMKERIARYCQRSNSSISVADEILKFKELMDAGIISSQEFETKKKQLLE